MIVAPSILSADFGNLERDIRMLHESAAEWIHVDVMDGVFVPNISLGFPIFEAVRSCSDKVMDVHLMIVEPERYIERFIAAGADSVTFHLEATDNPKRCIDLIRRCGAKVGVSIKPATPIEALKEIVEDVDMVLIMSVEPGFGGQEFIPESLERIKQLRMLNANILIEVDGGVSKLNARQLADAGADILVMGSAIFKSANPTEEIDKILDKI